MKVAQYLLLVFVLFSCSNEKKNMRSENLNDEIEVLTFEELEPLLSANDETIYVINFWATWCAPCIKELPHFQELHDTYGQYNVKVILVSLDFPEKIKKDLIPFIKKNKLTPEILVLNDPRENEWIPKVDASWSGALPATLIYHKSQRDFYEHSFTKESLFKEVTKFIKI